MKKIRYAILFTSFFLSLQLLKAQEFDFKNTTYYYRIGTDSLVSSGLTLASFNYSSANRANDSIFNDGIYFPANDCFGRNLWIRVRHIAEDPNGTSVGINIPSTVSNPCPFGNIMIGGWAGFLYDFEIHRDANLTNTRRYSLGPLYTTSITVASLETLSGSCGSAEWLSFMIVNSGSTGWSLNSINFTGSNLNSNPGFSDTMAVYTTGGCYPPDGFSYVFPTGADSISFISASANGYSEFKMSAGGISHFQYGYEYSGQAGGYQGMSMAFGTPPTYSVSVDDVTCKDGNDGEIHVTISGGIGPFTYEWNDSTSTGDSLAGLSAGTYRLTVTDQNGCGKIADTTFIIHQPENVSASLDSFKITNVQCHNGTDGSIQLYGNGNAPVTYHWNTGSDDSLLTGLSAGIYLATISDLNSCLVTRDTVTEPPAIDISTSVTPATISANATDATYQWYDCSNNTPIAGATSSSYTPIASGNYKVAINKDGCSDTSQCTAFAFAGIEENKLDALINVYPNPVTSVLFITLAKTYPAIEISITDLNGRQIVTKQESNKTSLALKVDQPAGIYFVSIKTNEGKIAKRILVE